MAKRTITVKFAAKCKGCGETIEPGMTAVWEKGIGIWHPKCDEDDEPESSEPGYADEPYICAECGRAYWNRTGNSCCSTCNSQYNQGVADANRYLSDKQIYGEELAEQWEMEAELARYNRGEDY